MATQLTLGLKLKDAATFDNFYVGPNEEIVLALKQSMETSNEPFIYLWGANACGRSHLLQACCHAMDQKNKRALYFPLNHMIDLEPAALIENLEQFDLICIDDLQKLLNQREWQEALFHLYNRLQQKNTLLFVSATIQASQLAIELPDLKSRLSHGVAYKLQALSDADKINALQMRAQRRGLELSDALGAFLLARLPREMHALFSFLDVLDQVSLEEQRRLTIPFVKQVLSAKKYDTYYR